MLAIFHPPFVLSLEVVFVGVFRPTHSFEMVGYNFTQSETERMIGITSYCCLMHTPRKL